MSNVLTLILKSGWLKVQLLPNHGPLDQPKVQP